MELSDQNIITLSNYLQQTLSPQAEIRRPAEKFLESVESNQNYPKLLLHLINKPGADLTIKVAGAVAFKNLVKRNWSIGEDGDRDKIHSDDRTVIKHTILDIMLFAPESIQKQLSDAISIIGKHDFPDKWPGLLDEMVNKFNTGDFYVINGVLHTAHSLFKRYRFEFKSQSLWSEIKYVLEKFSVPLTDLFEATIQLTVTHGDNPNNLKIIYSSLLIISKIFYSLNFQDLPEFFEDNMKTWMLHFHTLLTADVKCLETGDDEEAGLLEQLKSQICDNVALYALKYDEEFQPFLPNFVTDIWNLLISTGKQHKYDSLVSNSLQFLATVADRSHYRHLFETPDVLASICEKVVIPNMEFRDSDKEMFEDNAEEYIRRDIEGSDVDTRRRSACDLVKVLSRYFEDKMMQIFGQYVQAMLQQYASDPSCWRQKDAALYLVTSLANKGQTQRHGITQTSMLVSLPDFAAQHIIPELEKPNVNELPVIKADAIKYIMIFRSVLPSSVVIGTLPFMIRHLQAESQVVHTYAACCIEKMFLLRENNQPLLSAKELAPFANDLLAGLFGALHHQGQENEYIMKAIMRSFSSLQEAVIPYLGEYLPKLTEILNAVTKNPCKPHFNHYLFETITFSINIVCKSNPAAVASFEEALFPIFQYILQHDVQEFLPYIFQLLSLLLELHSEQGIPEVYLGLYSCLLAPALWERTGNVHPLVNLLRAYISKASPQQMESTLAVSGLLGVFQKLIASKANDHEGFHLLQCMIQHCSKEKLAPYNKQIFILLFQRLSSSRTTKYVKGLLVFFFFYSIYHGASQLISMVDEIQARMFSMVIERLIVPDVQKISGTVEVKVAAVGLTKLLCEAPELIDGQYAHFWAPLLKVLINLFEQPQDISVHPDDHYVEVDDVVGYEVAFSQLQFANKVARDPLQEVTDARIHLAQSLSKFSIAYPGKLNPLLANGLTESDVSHLKNYLIAANVEIK